MLLPMHIPVLLCGLICGWQWGLGVGFVLPLLRSVLFNFPVMYPNAIGMAFELAVYGLVIGYLYAHSKYQCVKALYKCLIPAMIAGRLVWGAGDDRADGSGRQRLYLAAVHRRRAAERSARHRAAAGADPRRDGAAGSDEAGALLSARARRRAGGMTSRDYTRLVLTI